MGNPGLDKPVSALAALFHYALICKTKIWELPASLRAIHHRQIISWSVEFIPLLLWPARIFICNNGIIAGNNGPERCTMGILSVDSTATRPPHTATHVWQWWWHTKQCCHLWWNYTSQQKWFMELEVANVIKKNIPLRFTIIIYHTTIQSSISSLLYQKSLVN